mmetsp:Transcript_760/g.1165  ORF Transcript_760/g.1165 Transcript_760/m.1165 type:complete len:140 (+) Transcript_760:52-471(+)
MPTLQFTEECSRVVKSWMGSDVAGSSTGGASSPAQDDLFVPRAARLGLGAKYVRHQHVAKLSAAEQQFQSKLSKCRDEQAGAGKRAAKKGSPAQDADSEESDEEGRTSSFRGKSSSGTKRPAPAIQKQPRGGRAAGVKR